MGVGIFILLVIVVIVIVAGVVLYATGAGLWSAKTHPDEDLTERDRPGGEPERPQHTTPTTEAQRGTRSVGSPHDDRTDA